MESSYCQSNLLSFVLLVWMLVLRWDRNFIWRQNDMITFCCIVSSSCISSEMSCIQEDGCVWYYSILGVYVSSPLMYMELYVGGGSFGCWDTCGGVSFSPLLQVYVGGRSGGCCCTCVGVFISLLYNGGASSAKFCCVVALSCSEYEGSSVLTTITSGSSIRARPNNWA